jgi:cytochrome c oxidase subunit 1
MAAASAELTSESYGESAAHGLWSWLTTVDHKRIGIMYLGAAALFFAFGGVEALMMRVQLFSPDNHFVSAQLFNELFTMHGTTMIFFVAMPGLIGLINCIVPLQIGARDVAYPRLNALSLWLFMAGGIFLNSSWLLGGAPNAGWFNYVPIASAQFSPGPGVDFYDLGLQLAGIGTLMTGINFLVTIINMRAPGMSLLRMPLFVWCAFVTMWLIAFAFPPLTVNLFLLMFDRFFNTNFFNVALGGDPILWMQLFWIFGHPEVYILILPAFGMISEVIPTFSRKPLFGYTSMVGAVLVIGLLAYVVWTHHMFTVGLGPTVNTVFAFTSMLIAVPTGIKIFNWIATMWRGQVRFDTPMLWAIGFIAMFTIGGMSGIMLAIAPADYQYNDSYFLVAHLHYVVIGGVLMGILAGLHYWWPKITGRMLNETLGKTAFWISLIGFNVTFFPMHFLGLMGMARRVSTYPPGLGLAFWNEVATIGAFILASGFVLMVVNLAQSLWLGERASADPWDARTLEWSISSPAPEYNFAYTPLIRGRDALWVEKTHGNGRIPSADPPSEHGDKGHHGIHMPSPTIVPLVLAIGMTAMAYGLELRQLWMILAGAVIAVYAVHRSLFDEDRGYVVEPPSSSLAGVPVMVAPGGGVAGVEHKGGAD